MALMTEIRIKPNGLHFKDILGREFKIGTNDLSHDESEFFKGTDNQKRIWDSGN